MPFEYRQDHLAIFQELPGIEQGPVGDVPAEWAEEMGFDVADLPELPVEQLSRQEVREHCENKPLLYGYLCAMAWGGQGWGPSGVKNSKLAWKNRVQIEVQLSKLRNERLSRCEAYDLFCKSGHIPGLGPAYFTKLLYFFGQEKNHYIMDQWTTKSVILLTGQNCIRHTNLGPTDYNTGFNYDLFCRIIDDLAEQMGCSGDVIEQRLFSLGSINRQPRGPWRAHTHRAWEKRPKLSRYNEDLCRREFGKLLQAPL